MVFQKIGKVMCCHMLCRNLGWLHMLWQLYQQIYKVGQKLNPTVGAYLSLRALAQCSPGMEKRSFVPQSIDYPQSLLKKILDVNVNGPG